MHLWKKALRHSLESSRVFRRNGVPKLGFPVVQIIDGMQVHVFGVPGKGRFPHAEVEVRGCNP